MFGFRIHKPEEMRGMSDSVHHDAKLNNNAVRLVQVGLTTLRAAPSQQQVSECSVTGGGGEQQEDHYPN